MSVAKNGSCVSSGVASVTSLNTGAAVTTSVANCLIVAGLVTGNGGSLISGSSISGGGLTWNKIAASVITGNLAPDGTSEFWFAWAAAAITNQTITANWSNSSDGLLAVQAFSGSQDYTSLTANTDYAVATNNSSGTGTDNAVSITTKKSGSWVVSISGFRNADSNSNDANCQSLATFAGGGSGLPKQALVERTDSPVNIGTYAIGFSTTNDLFGWTNAALEIIAASASFNPSWAIGATKVIGGVF